MRQILLNLLIFTNVLLWTTFAQDCGNFKNALDQQLESVLGISKGNKIPRTEEALGEYCTVGEFGLEFIKENKKCLEPAPPEVIELLVNKSNSLRLEQCENESKKKSLLTVTNCLTEESIKAVGKCIGAATAQLLYIFEKTAPEEKISGMCCSFQLLVRCIFDAGKNHCSKDEEMKQTVAKFMQKKIKGVIQPITDIACGEDENLEGCNKNKADLMKKLKEEGKKGEKGKEKAGDSFVKTIGVLFNKVMKSLEQKS